MIQEFKKFVMRGNILDLAIAVILGLAFKSIINSLVNDVIMPPVGLALGGVDFASMKWIIQAATETSAEVAISYGLFINTIIEFIIIAFILFLIIKSAAAAAKKEEEAPAPPPVPSEEVVLLSEIRDLLKK